MHVPRGESYCIVISPVVFGFCLLVLFILSEKHETKVLFFCNAFASTGLSKIPCFTIASDPESPIVYLR